MVLSWLIWLLFQSTLPLRGVTRRVSPDGHTALISIHTPLAGSDLLSVVCVTSDVIFQSTLPLRGVTLGNHAEPKPFHISIHTPLAGSDTRNETFLTK